MISNLIVVAALAAGSAQPAVGGQPAGGGQQVDPATELAALASRLEKAALNEDAQGVKDARIACMRMLAAAPSGPRAGLMRYTIAYAGWRLSFWPTVPAAEQNGLLADAESQLGQAVKADPSFAEAHGLLSMVYGAKISKNPELGMTLGMAADAAMGRAMALDSGSPRLVMMQGISLLHTPREYGGDPKQAEANFRRALQMFAKEPAGQAWPNWGLFDTHLWLGQALADRGDSEGARTEFKAALQVAPNSRHVKTLLANLK
jgi:tetratricopeptide (TPR) repeat protein